MLYSGLGRDAAEGLCSSPMTRCPVAASSAGREEEEEEEGGFLQAEPGPRCSWGLSKGRSCARTGNPAAGSPG